MADELFTYGDVELSVGGVPLGASDIEIRLDSRPSGRLGKEIEAQRTPQGDVRRLLDPASVTRKALGEFDAD